MSKALKRSTASLSSALEQQQRQVELRKEEIRQGLPHLYERDWYQWAWDFFKSENKMNLLVAANQISKSSTQIRKCIEWAGNKKLWPTLWKQTPRQFWYLYPDRATATREFNLKWVPEFLPRGAHKNHPTYGWQEFWGDRKQIAGIRFNSGVTLYFFTYEQNVFNVQSATVDAIFTDEELPEAFYDELNSRLIASNGYFHMVFTATLNQQMWRRALEGRGEAELFPNAFKQQISMRDCITYMNGKPGAFTEERIKEIEASCRSETERQRRVDGKFVTEVGRKYPQFDAIRHFKKPFEIPRDWRRYAGVDIGAGGSEDAHPPAIVFIAVRPDYRMGVVYKAWRGDDGSTYTNGDIFNKFLSLRGNEVLVAQKFDHAAKDFGTISQRAGESFMPAEKSHDIGEGVLNTLFKNDVLFLFTTPEIEKLGGELSNLMKSTAKRVAKDDLCDALRYGVVDIPWDWTVLKGAPSEEELEKERTRPLTDEELIARELDERRGVYGVHEDASDSWGELGDEIAFWNDLAGA